jgi:twitching motility protein PilT
VAKARTSAIVELLDALWEEKGTDLLLTAGSPPLLRVDGQLRRVGGAAVLQGADTEKLVMGLLGEELGDRFRNSKQLDFSFSWDDKARIRGNAFRQKGTIALSLRIVPMQVPNFDELGLPPAVTRWVKLPQGFVVVIGATGSGKSTSLAAMIDQINENRAVHIITIEDPIEYIHHHKLAAVEQREVGEDTESFAAALRSVLREDPDVLLVGEMRDPESIAAALTIAETGHLVFASLHANDTAQAVDRIVDVFPGDEQPQIRLQLASTLAGMLYQTLVPRIGGGRVAAFEVLNGTAAACNLIREGKSRQIRNVVATSQRDGMQTLEASLNDLIERGLITYDEAIARTIHAKEIKTPTR